MLLLFFKDYPSHTALCFDISVELSPFAVKSMFWSWSGPIILQEIIYPHLVVARTDHCYTVRQRLYYEHTRILNLGFLRVKVYNFFCLNLGGGGGGGGGGGKTIEMWWRWWWWWRENNRNVVAVVVEGKQ